MRRETVHTRLSRGLGLQALQGQPQAGRVTHVSVVSLLRSLRAALLTGRLPIRSGFYTCGPRQER